MQENNDRKSLLNIGLRILQKVSEEIKKEWIKEQVSFWRTITISATLGLFWIVIPWMQWVDSEAAQVIPNVIQEAVQPFEIIKQRQVVSGIFRHQATLQIIYLVVGPIFEGFYRTRRLSDLLLRLKKTT